MAFEELLNDPVIQKYLHELVGPTGTPVAAAPPDGEVTGRFGGPFTVETVAGPLGYLRSFEGAIAHLTMYGRPVQDLAGAVRSTARERPLLVAVGAEKVPFEVYERAEYNVAVTNQPHSEVAGLAAFLDRLFDGAELDREWTGADRHVVPRATGKEVIEADDDTAGGDGEPDS